MDQSASTPFGSAVCWDMAVVVHSLEATVKKLEAMGIGPFILPDPPEGAEGLFYEGKPLETDYKALVTRLGNMQLEIIEPPDCPNPWREFLETKGEGIHHVGLKVDDVEATADRLAEQGAHVPFVGKIAGKPGAAYVELNIANIVLELTSSIDLPE